MIEGAVAFLLLFGGLAILIFLLSQLSAAVDSLISKQTSDTRHQQGQSQPDENYRHPVEAAITSYEQKRETHEHARAQREVITIRVLLATGGFALMAAGAAVYSGWIFRAQLNEAKADSRLTERAFVNIRELNSKQILRAPRQNAPDDVLWEFSPVFENSGKTPAVNVQMAIITPLLETTYYGTSNPLLCDIHKSNMSPISQKEYEILAPADPDIVFSWDKDKKKPFLSDIRYIGPNRSIAPEGTHWVETIAGFQCATWWFYFGSIHYDDFFGEPHISKFCFLVNPAALGSLSRPQAPAIDPCAHWNCMDESCIKDAEQYKTKINAADYPK
jgi:hypothetical protein